MTGWIPYVFVRVALCFAAGILLGMYCPAWLNERGAAILLAVLVGLYLLRFLAELQIGKKLPGAGLIALPALVVAGYLCLLLHTGSRQSGHFMLWAHHIDYYEAVLTQDPQERGKTWKAEARVHAIYADGWREAHGKVLLYFSKAGKALAYRYGDVLVVKGAPRPVPAPANPGEFDYRHYLANRNVYHQHFLRYEQVRQVRHDPPNVIMDYALALRRAATAILEKYVQGRREQAAALALVLGVTDELDPELMRAYAATGTMHVLAVSGLHVSVLYLILSFCFRPLQRLRHGPWVLALVSLVVLWGYALVTGLSPSVLRAVVMFSFVVLARAWRRNTHIYNTLAASAFCLLLFDPYLLLSVGFQLSFLAVLGIVYIHPRLYARWEPRRRWAGEIWKITSVSVAAQVATFPLGLLYFHQFPNYFLFSNLFAVPGSALVLAGGLVVLVCSVVPPVAMAAGFVLTALIRALNGIIFLFEALPYGLVEDIHISPLQCGLLMLIIMLLLALLASRKFRFVKSLALACAIFAGLQWWHYASQVNVSRLTVYAIAGHTALDFMDCGRAVFYADTALLGDGRNIDFHVRPNRVARGIRAVDIYPTPATGADPGYRIIACGGTRVLHLWRMPPRLPEAMPVDYIVVSRNAVADLSVLCTSVDPALVILDSSNSYAYARRVLSQSAVLSLPVYSVPHAGAYDAERKSRDHDEIYRL